MAYPHLSQLLAASEKATPGPLHVEGRRVMADNGWLVAEVTGPNPRTRGKEWREENECCLANADFIAFARNSTEELTLLLTRVQKLEAMLQEFCDYTPGNEGIWGRAKQLRAALEATDHE